MDTPATQALGIHCASCNAAFKSRLAAGDAREAWRQRTAVKEDYAPITAYLCDRCAARFSSHEAALDFLDGVIEQRLEQGENRGAG